MIDVLRTELNITRTDEFC